MISNKPQSTPSPQRRLETYELYRINTDYSGKLIPNTSYLIPDTLSVVSVKSVSSVFH